jgi:hypothetical protein
MSRIEEITSDLGYPKREILSKKKNVKPRLVL